MHTLRKQIAIAIALTAILVVAALNAKPAHAEMCDKYCGLEATAAHYRQGFDVHRHRHHLRHRHRHVAKYHRAAKKRRSGHRSLQVFDASGNAVRSSTGVVVRVAPAARAALQCVVDYVEAHGVRIKSMRGYGTGTVRHSLHPSGRALDINQTDRDVTHPYVPRAISNAAADHCGVISGARWGDADNGHWNLSLGARRHRHSRGG